MSEPLFTIPEPEIPEPVVARMTERDVLDVVLGRYYSQRHGNGPRYAIAEHVRSVAGFGGYWNGGQKLRTADLIVMDLWPSKGLNLIGHEVKVSRSDWLTELRDPDKADAFRRYMDRWYLVAPTGVVRDDLPAGWGLIEIRSDYGGCVRSAVVTVPAPVLTPEPLPKTMLAALLRATAKTARRTA